MHKRNHPKNKGFFAIARRRRRHVFGWRERPKTAFVNRDWKSAMKLKIRFRFVPAMGRAWGRRPGTRPRCEGFLGERRASISCSERPTRFTMPAFIASA